VPNYLGPMTQCEDPVNSRILSALNQAVISGFQNLDKEVFQRQSTLEVYVTSVSIKLSVQNGVSITNITESGVALQRRIENK
jgi:hypothetical protein